ncbi:hypothetical protein JCM11641_002151 [Rhodosporidiobolus odoratus]
MTTPAAQKVLVLGPPSTGIKTYFTKLEQLQKKHSFNLVLTTDLFSNLDNNDDELNQLLSGSIKIPVQVYAAQGTGTLPDKVIAKVAASEEITTNLTVLPKSGLLTLASGLRIATLSGGSSSSANPFTASDIATLVSSVSPPAPPNSSLPAPPPKPADILLTSLCPSSLPLQSTVSLTPLEGREPESVYAKELDEAASAVRAKYHFFDAPGKFWEREAFVWPALEGAGAGGPRTFCRAIGLGAVGSKAGGKSLYAFNITPSVLPTPPTSYTPSPFHPSHTASAAQTAATLNGSSGPRGLKRPAPVNPEDVNEMGVPNYIFAGQGGQGGERKKGRNGGGERGGPPDHYTCHLCQQKGHWIQDCPEKEQRDMDRDSMRAARGMREGGAGGKPISPDDCWFCLSNPKVTKHLIASIGSEVYLTLPKGQVCSVDSSPVPGGGHVLLIPIAHYPTLRSIPTDLAPPVLEEVELYKQALKKCYASFGAEMVCFEVARAGARGGHAHVQICPIPASLTSEASSTFETQAQKYGYDLEEITSTSDFYAKANEDGKGCEYFKVDLPDGRSLVHWIKPGGNGAQQQGAGGPKGGFSLQFGRETLAILLHAPDRADWKKCVKDDQVEKKDCQEFKKAFKSFDPSM